MTLQQNLVEHEQGFLVQKTRLTDADCGNVFVHGGDNNRINNRFAVLTNPHERFAELEWAPLAMIRSP